jgi:diguanylate cyclase (GGDEF)-like protein
MSLKSPEQQYIPQERTDDPSERIAALEKTVAELKKENERIPYLERLAYTDELTGLPNRYKLKEEFERRKEYLAEHSGGKEENPDAILMLDLDNFKIVNDAFKGGHFQADRVLKEAADHLVTLLKEQFREDDIVARIGGEEFVALLKNVDPEGIMKRLTLGFLATLDGEKIPITFSGGLTTLRPNEELLDALVRADAALYVAKEDKIREDGSIDRGRNRVFEYTDKMAQLKENVPVRDLPSDDVNADTTSK